MSFEDTIRSLKIISTITIGHFAGAGVYTTIAIQPSLIEQENVPTAARTMRGMLSRSAIMPLAALGSSATSLAIYFKTRGTSFEDRFWLFSGGAMLILIPYTIKYISPINRKFQQEPEPTFEGDDEKWTNLLSDWLTFHTPRALVSFTLFSITVYKLVK